MALPTANASWRDTARYPKFLFLDSRAVFPFFIFLVHIRLWTFIVAVVFMIFFSLLMRFGFTLGVFMRFLRAFFAGRRRVARPWWAYGYR